MLRLIVTAICLAVVCAAATSKEPSGCGSRPCVYVIRCAGETCTTAESDEVQAALNDAHPGDTIKLEAGKAFPVTRWMLPAKDGSPGWITLTTTRDADLPDEDTRITPASAPLLPRIVANGPPRSAIYAEPGNLPRPAERYRLVGLMFINRAGASFGGGLLTIGNPNTFRHAFTANPASGTLVSATSHPVETGQYVQLTTTGVLPAGLDSTTRYYVTRVNARELRLSLTRTGPAVVFTDAGTGEHTYLEEGVSRPEHQPRDIVIDRCYFTATPADNVRRLVGIHGTNITVRNSFLENGRDSDTDSQAILSYNGAGPFTIENNYLEGAAENVMFGGALGSAIANPPVDPNGLTPADIVMRYNYLPKNPARLRLETWKAALWVEPGKPIRPSNGAGYSLVAMNAGYTGAVEPVWPETLNATVTDGEVVWRAWSPTAVRRWIVKNSFEIKAAERATIQYNVFDRTWTDGQRVAINLKTANQPRPNGEQYIARTENVVFRDNVIRSAPAALTISRDRNGIWRNWEIRNNLFYDIDARLHGDGTERQLSFLSLPMQGLTFEHNTIVSPSSAATLVLESAASPDPHIEAIIFRNNLLQRGRVGVHGTGAGEGNAAVNRYLCGGVACPPNTVSPNVIAGVNRNVYPEGTFNLCLTPLACDSDLLPALSTLFKNASLYDFSLPDDSPFRGMASDGTDMGADTTTLPRITDFRVETTSTKAVLYYRLTAPIQHIPCVLEAGRRPDFSDAVADLNPALFHRADSDRRATAVTDGPWHSFVVGSDMNEAGMDGNVYSRALQPNTKYHYRLQCGGDARTGEFTTLEPSGSGSKELRIQVAATDGMSEAMIEYGTAETGAPLQFGHVTPPAPCTEGCEIPVSVQGDSVFYYRVRYIGDGENRWSAVQAVTVR